MTIGFRNRAVRNAQVVSVSADKITAGTITGQQIVVAGGAAGILRSDNFVAGVSGWRLRGGGDAEFNNVTVRDSTVTGSLTVTGDLTITGVGTLFVLSGTVLFSSAGDYLIYDDTSNLYSLVSDSAVASSRLEVGRLAIRDSRLYWGTLDSGTPDYITYDDSTNRWTFVSDGTSDVEVGPGGVSLLGAGGYYFSGFDSATEDRIGFDDSTNRFNFVADGATANSDLRAGAFTVVSSIRWKTDLETVQRRAALESCRRLQPVTYRLRGQEGGRRRLGFIAEEMCDVLPEVVGFDADGLPDGIDYGRITALLVGGVQELADRLERVEEAAK